MSVPRLLPDTSRNISANSLWQQNLAKSGLVLFGGTHWQWQCQHFADTEVVSTMTYLSKQFPWQQAEGPWCGIFVLCLREAGYRLVLT